MTNSGAGSERGGQRDMDSLLNGVGFAGVQSGEPKFMGSSSGSAYLLWPLDSWGCISILLCDSALTLHVDLVRSPSSLVSLARMVLSSVMKTGPAGATHPNYHPSPSSPSTSAHQGSPSQPHSHQAPTGGGAHSFDPSSPHNHAEAEALDALAQLAQQPEFTTSASTAGSHAPVSGGGYHSGSVGGSVGGGSHGGSGGGNGGIQASESHERGGDGMSSGGMGGRPRVKIPALPPRAAIERLLEVYIEYIQFHSPTLHMPTFLKQVRWLFTFGFSLDQRSSVVCGSLLISWRYMLCRIA